MTTKEQRAAGTAGSYDDFAVIYNRHWGPRYAATALESLEPLLLARIPPGAKILDLCCGAGQVSRLLTDRGFSVFGVDASASLVALARNNAPSASFEVADARRFSLHQPCHAAISLNDSLNHLLTIEDLEAALLNVGTSLLSGGIFLFDLNLAQKYEIHWAGSFSIIEDDAVCAAVTTRTTEKRLARFDAAVFVRDAGVWMRKDVRLLQTWYAPDDVRAALERTGFADVRVTDREGAVLANYEADKAFFTCTRM